MEIGGAAVEVRAGGCILFPPGMPQYFTAQIPLIHNWFHATAGLSPLITQYQIPQGVVFYPENFEFITDLVQKMERERFSNQNHKEILIDGYLQELLILLSRSIDSQAYPAKEKNVGLLQVREMRQQILTRPTHRWTVEKMADLVGLSPSRFHAVYKAQFGVSPMQDLISSRIEYAKDRLLLQSETPVSALAEALGYNDQYHFIRQFRKEVGITPGQFRKIYGM